MAKVYSGATIEALKIMSGEEPCLQPDYGTIANPLEEIKKYHLPDNAKSEVYGELVFYQIMNPEPDSGQ